MPNRLLVFLTIATKASLMRGAGGVGGLALCGGMGGKRLRFCFSPLRLDSWWSPAMPASVGARAKAPGALAMAVGAAPAAALGAVAAAAAAPGRNGSGRGVVLLEPTDRCPVQPRGRSSHGYHGSRLPRCAMMMRHGQGAECRPDLLPQDAKSL
jgi:hypothetical protein